jgi:hypothetical protein
MGEDSNAKSAICCADAVLWPVTDLFNRVTFDELQSVVQNWIQRLKSVSRHNGEYFIR